MNTILVSSLLRSYGATNAAPQKGKPLAYSGPMALVENHPLFVLIAQGKYQTADSLIRYGAEFDPNDLSGGHDVSRRFVDLLWRCSKEAIKAMTPSLGAWSRPGYFTTRVLESEPYSHERFDLCRRAVHYVNRRLDGGTDHQVHVRVVQTREAVAECQRELAEWRREVEAIMKTPVNRLYKLMRLNSDEYEFAMNVPDKRSGERLFEDLQEIEDDGDVSSAILGKGRTLIKIADRIVSCSSIVKQLLHDSTALMRGSDSTKWSGCYIEARGPDGKLQGMAEMRDAIEGGLRIDNVVSGWWNADQRLKHTSAHIPGVGYGLFEKFVELSFKRGCHGALARFIAYSNAHPFYERAGCKFTDHKPEFIPESGVPTLLNNSGGRSIREPLEEKITKSAAS